MYSYIEIEALNFSVIFVSHELNFKNVNRLCFSKIIETYCLFNIYCR